MRCKACNAVLRPSTKSRPAGVPEEDLCNKCISIIHYQERTETPLKEYVWETATEIPHIYPIDDSYD